MNESDGSSGRRCLGPVSVALSGLEYYRSPSEKKHGENDKEKGEEKQKEKTETRGGQWREGKSFASLFQPSFERFFCSLWQVFALFVLPSSSARLYASVKKLKKPLWRTEV